MRRNGRIGHACFTTAQSRTGFRDTRSTRGKSKETNPQYNQRRRLPVAAPAPKGPTYARGLDQMDRHNVREHDMAKTFIRGQWKDDIVPNERDT